MHVKILREALQMSVDLCPATVPRWTNSCAAQETMGNHCLSVFAGESSSQGFLGGAGFRPSTVLVVRLSNFGPGGVRVKCKTRQGSLCLLQSTLAQSRAFNLRVSPSFAHPSLGADNFQLPWGSWATESTLGWPTYLSWGHVGGSEGSRSPMNCRKACARFMPTSSAQCPNQLRVKW